MEDKELEKLIKESADKIEMKPFEERWNAIEGRLQKKEKKKGVNFKLVRWASLAASFCLVLALAIILPLVLKPAPEPMPEPPPVSYFDETELDMNPATKDNFYFEINKTKMQVVDFSHLTLDKYFLGTTQDLIVKGGKIENQTSVLGYLFTIIFYDNTIILKESNYTTLTSTLTVNNIEVRFKEQTSEVEEGIFITESTALLTYKDVTYIVEYISEKDDLSTFLSGIFQ